MSCDEDGVSTPELFAIPELSAPAPTATPRPFADLREPRVGPLILGTDKRNPVFTVYKDNSGERLIVYCGFEVLEIVNNDREDPAFKLLLARLSNAGINLGTLCRTFEVDPKTVRGYGKALRVGDPVELIRVLAGRSTGRKRTLAVDKFAYLRWPSLVAQGSYGAVARLLEEIESVFGVTIFRSALRGSHPRTQSR